MNANDRIRVNAIALAIQDRKRSKLREIEELHPETIPDGAELTGIQAYRYGRILAAREEAEWLAGMLNGIKLILEV